VSPKTLVAAFRAPREIAQRWSYVRHQRQLVAHATNVFDVGDEAERCFRYWAEWNRLVETASAGRPLFRFRLEDLGPATWNGIARFLETPLGDFPTLEPANLKTRYPSRTFPAVSIPADVRALAAEYGYELAEPESLGFESERTGEAAKGEQDAEPLGVLRRVVS
jgi:hypothetical protein